MYGTVFNSLGEIVPNAQLAVITSQGNRIYNTDSNGVYLFDLSDIGYTEGETATIDVTEQFNNELVTDSFVVSGFFTADHDITLVLRTRVENISNLNEQNVLHSVGKKPITANNPLPIFNETNPLDGYMLAGGDDNNQIYGYINSGGAWYIQKFNNSDKTYKYVKGPSDFISNWNARTTLNYSFPNEVF